MNILAHGLLLATSAFNHVDYVSATQSDQPALSTGQIAAIVVIGSALIIIISSLITWGIFSMRKRRDRERSKKEDAPKG